MWVDALCIDQGNMAERSLQVAHMSEIYAGAARVNVWLGPESGDSGLAMRTLGEISEAVELDLASQTFVPSGGGGGVGLEWVERNKRLPISDEQIEAICNLFKRAWFERLWVWQEVRLGSPKSLVICGHEAMPWMRFYVVGFFLRWKQEFGLGHRYAEIEPFIEIVNGMMNNITQSPMATLSLRTCWSKCTEPRDRVYALMGITTDEVRLKPDYSLSIADVYKDVPIQHLAQLKNLELLSSCHWRGEEIEKERGDLPTWAPDWRTPNQRKRYFDLVGAGEPSADEAQYIAPNILEVSGVLIDTITSVTPLPKCSSSSAQAEQEVLETLRSIAPPSLLEIPYIAGGTSFDAYCRTFFANEFTDRYKPAGELLGFQPFQVAREVLLSSSASPPPPARVAHFIKDFQIQTSGRSLACTDNGYVALVPDESHAGDRIVHVLGSRWPITLRPVAEDGHQVIGHAYVDGDNDREALLGPLPEGFKGVAMYDASTAKWWPMIFEESTGECRVEDPRLGKLPEGWKVRSGHAHERLFNWYVEEEKEGTEAEKRERERKLETMKMELRWRSDPRFKVRALRERKVKVDRFRLV